jgi:hypothetical protein
VRDNPDFWSAAQAALFYLPRQKHQLADGGRMAFGSLSIEARGSALVRELGISLAFLSSLTGVEQSKLSLGFRQLKAFNSSESEKLSTTLNRLLVLQSSLAPLSLDLRNPSNTRLVVDALKEQDSEAIRVRVSALFE